MQSKTVAANEITWAEWFRAKGHMADLAPESMDRQGVDIVFRQKGASQSYGFQVKSSWTGAIEHAIKGVERFQGQLANEGFPAVLVGSPDIAWDDKPVLKSIFNDGWASGEPPSANVAKCLRELVRRYGIRRIG